jgi:S-(hydroxymethyl)glutathione dehydrogenase/alcohol dehydrogenase
LKVKAAVLYEIGTPLAIEELELDAPKNGEVLVRIAANGVCRSDHHVMVGEWTVPLPIVLGHEAAGVVEAVGSGVTRSKPGDHVILSFRPSCGWCRYCIRGRPVLCNGSSAPRWQMFDGTVRLHRGDVDINHYARVAGLAEYAVVPESGAVPVRKDMPLDQASLIGCSVTTGVCAVINAAKVEPGSSVAVFGCGGVGLNIIQGAVLAGANQIIAVDILENKLAYAKEFGATDTILGDGGGIAERIRDITDGGADYAFDAIGDARIIEQAYECTRPGGATVLVGMAPETEEIKINALSFPRSEKMIMGSWYGSARPWYDLPKMADLYLSGKLKIDELLTRTYRLDEVNEAYEAMAQGEVARSIIKFD